MDRSSLIIDLKKLKVAHWGSRLDNDGSTSTGEVNLEYQRDQLSLECEIQSAEQGAKVSNMTQLSPEAESIT